MRLEIYVVKSNDSDVHLFGVEVENDVIIVYLDNVELFKTDLDNFEELMTAVGMIWLNLTKKESVAK